MEEDAAFKKRNRWRCTGWLPKYWGYCTSHMLQCNSNWPGSVSTGTPKASSMSGDMQICFFPSVLLGMAGHARTCCGCCWVYHPRCSEIDVDLKTVVPHEVHIRIATLLRGSKACEDIRMMVKRPVLSDTRVSVVVV